ncbi:MAG: NAD-dependent epimerase/dehydratase family protein, partial [Azospirillaceae bacterium]
ADARVIHHCADPPFDRWPRELPPVMIGLIQAAARSGASVIYADDPSVYGPVEGPISESLPDRPVGARARVRAGLAGLLLSAHRQGAVSAAIARAPDLFGPGVVRSALGRPMIEAAMKGLPVPVIGDPDQPHSLCFIRDHAAAMVALAERPDLHGRIWHTPCAPAVSLRTALETAGGRPVRLRRASRGLLLALGLADARLRAIREITYQFDRPFVLDTTALEEAAGLAPTPLERALAETRAAFRQAGRPRAARLSRRVGAVR